jgi:hypothetical protein
MRTFLGELLGLIVKALSAWSDHVVTLGSLVVIE